MWSPSSWCAGDDASTPVVPAPRAAPARRANSYRAMAPATPALSDSTAGDRPAAQPLRASAGPSRRQLDGELVGDVGQGGGGEAGALGADAEHRGAAQIGAGERRSAVGDESVDVAHTETQHELGERHVLVERQREDCAHARRAPSWGRTHRPSRGRRRGRRRRRRPPPAAACPCCRDRRCRRRRRRAARRSLPAGARVAAAQAERRPPSRPAASRGSRPWRRRGRSRGRR